MQTIDEAKQFLRDNLHAGAKCPCCGQQVKCYKYKLYGTAARALIDLYKLGNGYHHVSQYAEAGAGRLRAPHFAELRFWGLIERRPLNDNPKKRSSGYWRITKKGKLFVRGEITVNSRILVYNGKFQGFAPDSVLINIKDALGNDFDYRELMTN